MMKSFLLLFVLFFSFVASESFNGELYVLTNIDGIGHHKLDLWKSASGLWIEVGTEMLMKTNKSALEQMRRFESFDERIVELKWIPGNNETHLILLFHARNNTFSSSWNMNILVHRHGFAVIKPTDLKTEHTILEQVNGATIFDESQGSLVLARLDLNDDPSILSIPPPPFPTSSSAASIKTLVAEVNKDRWFAAVTKLASYNRYTLGTQIAEAQAWILDQLQALPGVQVAVQQFPISGRNGYNVLGRIVGTERPNDWILVGAHYDSTSQSPSTAAPGAEDNASGSAAVLEIAKILSKYPPPATVIFILYSGEEQGLVGSKAHVANLISSGDKSKVKLVHTMDMIAYKLAKNPNRVLIETGKAFESWFSLYRSAAVTYTGNLLGVVTSTNYFGSDHVPYINENIPGILSIDADYDSYPFYHRVGDVPSALVPDVAYDIIKTSIAVIATTAGYPA